MVGDLGLSEREVGLRVLLRWLGERSESEKMLEQ